MTLPYSYNMPSQKLSIQTANQLDLQNVSFGINKSNNKTKIFIPVSYLVGSKLKELVIQTQPLYTPFGVGAFNLNQMIATGRSPSYSIVLSLPDTPLRAFLKELDDLICATVGMRPEVIRALNINLCKKDGTKKRDDELLEMVEGAYTPIVRKGKEMTDGNRFDPTMKIKISRNRKGEIDTIYDAPNGKQIALDDRNMLDSIPAKSLMRTIIKVSQVWVVGSRFGVNVKVQRLNVLECASTKQYEWI